MSLTPCDALEAIQQIMSGQRWTSETLEAIAETMERAGYTLRDFGEEIPGARIIRSPMGGEWIVPLTPAASETLMDFFGEEPSAIEPLGGRTAYIVEPSDGASLTEYLISRHIAWEVE